MIEIGNVGSPLYSETFSQIQNRIQTIIADVAVPLNIREGLQISKSITVIRGSERLHFVKGIHYQ